MPKIIVLIIFFLCLDTVAVKCGERLDAKSWSKITAEVPEEHYVTGEIWLDSAYIKIPYFHSLAYAQTKALTDEFIEKGISKLILDLRFNHGGLLEEAIKVAGLFVPKGLICTAYIDDKNVEYKSGNEKIYFDIIVLTNAMTASSAELLTAAIKDSEAGISVGSVTYGKNTIQSIVPSGDGGANKTTIGKFMTRNKRDIGSKGIVPDYEVTNEFRDGKEIDLQLSKAKELINCQRIDDTAWIQRNS